MEPAHTVADVKELVAGARCVPPCQQRLLFRGRQLCDDATLAECSVGSGDTIHLALRLLGGTQYVCGDCGTVNDIKPKDPIRCRSCGYRIMYKIRTKTCARRRLPLTEDPLACAQRMPRMRSDTVRGALMQGRHTPTPRVRALLPAPTHGAQARPDSHAARPTRARSGPPPARACHCCGTGWPLLYAAHSHSLIRTSSLS